MVVIACLRHWYESLIFFGPIPVVGFWVWMNGRRESRKEDAERFVKGDGRLRV
jgi:hypothetical protein